MALGLVGTGEDTVGGKTQTKGDHKGDGLKLPDTLCISLFISVESL